MSNSLSDDVVAALSVAFELDDAGAIMPDSTFEDLGSTSVFLLRLLVALWRHFDVDLDVADMYSVDDVAGLVRLVDVRTCRSGLAPT